MKLYTLNSIFDFGQCKGESLKNIFEKNPSYINWCFQKIDWFCITDDIFDNLPIILSLKKDKDHKDLFKNLENIHENKKRQLDNNQSENIIIKSENYSELDDKNWLEDAAGTDDPETMNDVFWNLD